MTRPEPCAQGLAQRVRAQLISCGQVPQGSVWTAVIGGRSNLVWRIDPPGQPPLICKLSRPGRDTPLFPNRPQDESRALSWLRGSGLAPDPVHATEGPDGPILLYRWVSGRPWRFEDPAEVGQLLARLHARSAPAGLRRVPGSGAKTLADADATLAAIPRDLRDPLRNLRPHPRKIAGTPPVFLHGDPVPDNIIVGPAGPVLIDWQCPALGDPLHDLALFLSPAMQTLNRGQALSAAERTQFWRGYDDPAQSPRFVQAEPAHLWQVAVHCAWRIGRGDVSYVAPLAAESERLRQLREQESD